MRRISASVNSGRARKSSLAVQPDADAVGGTAAAALALVGAGLRDRFDGQPLDLGAVAVAGDPGEAGIDDVLDARDGERGLGDVGRQNDPAPGVRLEDPVLLGVREPGVQRQDLGEPVVLLGEGVRGVPDLPLAGEEDQDVALALCHQLLDGVGDRGDLVAVGVVGVLFEERPVAHLHRVRAPADLDDRGVAEVPGEALGVDGRRGDDDLQVRALRQQLGEVAQQEVDVEGPLVGLVDDDRVVGAQLAVGLDLGEQDAVRHQLDEGGVRVHLVGEADLPADGLAEGVRSSSATRSATVRAAIRRGWVCPIMPRTPRPSSRQIFGIWVVLPEPVSPATMTTW